jgi:hypothetical protein
MRRIFYLPIALAVTAIALALSGSAATTVVHAQAQGAYTQPSAASGSSGGTASAASNCTDSDSWCKYCAQHLSVAACSTYEPGNGIASATGGVDPANASQGGAGGGDGGGGY